MKYGWIQIAALVVLLMSATPFACLADADLKEFQQMLTKITVEAAQNAELDDHLGYIKHEPSDADNARNWLQQ